MRAEFIVTVAIFFGLISPVISAPPAQRAKTVLSSDGLFAARVDPFNRKITVSPVKLRAKNLIKVEGKWVPVDKPEGIAPWVFEVDNRHLYASTVSLVNNGNTVVIVCWLARMPDIGWPPAVMIYHRNGKPRKILWELFLDPIVEIKPKHSEEQQYHWLKSIDLVRDDALKLTNARGGTASGNLKTGKLTKRTYGETENKRDPFLPLVEPTNSGGGGSE